MSRRQYKLITYFIITIVITFGLTLAYQYGLAEWDSPDADPPGLNVTEPLNVSIVGQAKQAGLIINSGDEDENGLIIPFGNVGIGTINPSHKLTVETVDGEEVLIGNTLYKDHSPFNYTISGGGEDIDLYITGFENKKYNYIDYGIPEWPIEWGGPIEPVLAGPETITTGGWGLIDISDMFGKTMNPPFDPLIYNAGAGKLWMNVLFLVHDERPTNLFNTQFSLLSTDGTNLKDDVVSITFDRGISLGSNDSDTAGDTTVTNGVFMNPDRGIQVLAGAGERIKKFQIDGATGSVGIGAGSPLGRFSIADNIPSFPTGTCPGPPGICDCQTLVGFDWVDRDIDGDVESGECFVLPTGGCPGPPPPGGTCECPAGYDWYDQNPNGNIENGECLETQLNFTNTGSLGIGTMSPSTDGDQPLLLDVEGAVGASYYCNADGNSCFTPSEMGGYWSPGGAEENAEDIYNTNAEDGAGVGIRMNNAIKAGGVDALASARDVQVVGKYAYVLSGSATESLVIYDISSSTDPIELGSATTGTGVNNALYVAGNYAYVVVAAGLPTDDLFIFDISNPTAPALVSSLQILLNNNADDIYISGKYAYIAARGSNKLEIVDISDPLNPFSVSKTAVCPVYGIYVQGKYAYVGCSNNGFRVVDISDPVNPIQGNPAVVNCYSPSEVYVSGKYAYMSCDYNGGGGGFTIIDVSDPSNPFEENDWSGSAVVNDIYVSGNYAYLAVNDSDNALVIIDVSDPTNLRWAGSGTNTVSGGTGVYVSGKYAYLTTSSGDDFEIFDISGLDAPTATIGDLAVGTLDVWENAQIANNLYVSNGLNVGSGGILSQGPLSTSDNLAMINHSYIRVDDDSDHGNLNIANLADPQGVFTYHDNDNPAGNLAANVRVEGLVAADKFCLKGEEAGDCKSDWGAIAGSLWTQNGTDIYPNVIGWNVGIGTIDPSYKLEVIGDIGGTVLRAGESPADEGVNGFNSVIMSYSLADDYASIEAYNKDTDPIITFASKPLLLNPFFGGNVGIGLNYYGLPLPADKIPDFKLDIRDNDETAIIRIDQDNADRKYAGLRLDRQLVEKWFVGMDDVDDDFIIRRNDSDNAFAVFNDDTPVAGESGVGAKNYCDENGENCVDVGSCSNQDFLLYDYTNGWQCRSIFTPKARHYFLTNRTYNGDFVTRAEADIPGFTAENGYDAANALCNIDERVIPGQEYYAHLSSDSWGDLGVSYHGNYGSGEWGVATYDFSPSPSQVFWAESSAAIPENCNEWTHGNILASGHLYQFEDENLIGEITDNTWSLCLASYSLLCVQRWDTDETNWTQDGDNLYTTNLDSNVGVGTIDPQDRLHVQDTTDPNVIIGEDNDNFTMMGYNSASDYGAISTKEGGSWYGDTMVFKGGNVGIGKTPLSYKLLDVKRVYTDTSGQKTGIDTLVEMDPTGTYTSGVVSGGYIHARTSDGNTQDFSQTFYGLSAQSEHKGTGVLAIANGLNGGTYNDNTGTITEARGGNFWVSNFGSGQIDTARSIRARTVNTGGGVIDLAQVIFIASPSNSSTINDLYGLYIEPQTGATGDNFNIYSDGAGTLNYFAGDVSIGEDFYMTDDKSIRIDRVGNHGNLYIGNYTDPQGVFTYYNNNVPAGNLAANVFAEGAMVADKFCLDGTEATGGTCVESWSSMGGFWELIGDDIRNTNIGNVEVNMTNTKLLATVDTYGAGGPDAYSIYVSGRYAYMVIKGNGSAGIDGLQIFDIGNPGNPQFVGSADLNGYGYGNIQVVGGYAYLISSQGWIEIFDVTDPSNPAKAGEFDGTSENALYVSGKYLYTAVAGSEGMRIYDISDPGNIRFISKTNTGWSEGVYVQGKYAYVAQVDTSMEVFDISDVDNPVSVGSYSHGINNTRTKGIYVSGKYAYLVMDENTAANAEEFVIVDISDPPNFVEVGSYNTDTDIEDVYVAGNYAYLVTDEALGDPNFQVIDISDPATPVYVDGYVMDNRCTDIFVSGKYAYITCLGNTQNDDSLKVFDLSGLDAPAARIGAIEVGSLDIWENAQVANNLYVDNGLNVGIGGVLSRGPLSTSEDLSMVDGKSIRLDKEGGHSGLFVGNYTDDLGWGFLDITGGVAANIFVEGAVDANQLCIKNDCKSDWSGVGGTPGGNNMEIQYNDNGSFNGATGFVYDNVNNRLGFNETVPLHTWDVRSSENVDDVFRFYVTNDLSSERDVFTIQDNDTAGTGQDESSVLKVYKSGAINAESDGHSLVELTYTGGVYSGDRTFYMLGRLVNEGEVSWGISLEDSDFWTTGSIRGGATGYNCAARGAACFDSQSFQISASGPSYINSGNVGIGQTNPQELLVVRGDNPKIKIVEDSDATNFGTISAWEGNKDFVISRNGTGGADFSIQEDGDIIIGQQGNVGIGTETPNRDLHVYNTDVNAEINIQSIAGVDEHWAIYHYPGKDQLRFWVNKGGETNVLTLDDEGHVGIMEADPQAALDVDGDIRFRDHVSCSALETDADGDLVCGTDDGGTGLWSNDGPGAPAEIYYNGGNVGIGTNDPAVPFHIESNDQHVMTLKSNNAGYGFMSFWNGEQVGNIMFQNAAKHFIIKAEDGYDLQLEGGSLPDDVVYTNDNFGVGTNVPQERLEIWDDTANPNSEAKLRVTNTVGNPELQMQYGSGDDHWALYSDQSNSDSFKIWSNNGGGGNEGDRLRITQDGKVSVNNGFSVGKSTSEDPAGSEIRSMFSGLTIGATGSPTGNYSNLSLYTTLTDAGATGFAAGIQGISNNVLLMPGSVTLTSVSGVESLVDVSGDVLVLRGDSVYISANDVGTAYGSSINIGGTDGDIFGTAYGLYIDYHSSTVVTNKYGVYVDDTGAINYFGGSVGIGTDNPAAGAALEVQGGAIKATDGLIIETRSGSDPGSPATGQIWLRTDL